MANRNGDHQLKRIVLPSGKTIEVVYFESLASEMPPAEPVREAAAPAPGTDTDLHVGPGLPERLGRGRRVSLEHLAALPELRVGPGRRLPPGAV